MVTVICGLTLLLALLGMCGGGGDSNCGPGGPDAY